MSDDFEQVTKYLDITPSSVSDDTSLKQNQGIEKTRRIQKIPAVLTIPAGTFTGVSTAWPRIVAQFNCTVDRPWFVNNIDELRGGAVATRVLLRSFLCLKWRVGETVSRYHLSTRGDYTSRKMLADTYINQEVPENFVIEVWSRFGTTWGLNSDLDIKLSWYYNPDYPDELKRTIATAEATRDTLFHDMPLELPIPFGEDSAWLSN